MLPPDGAEEGPNMRDWIRSLNWWERLLRGAAKATASHTLVLCALVAATLPANATEDTIWSPYAADLLGGMSAACTSKPREDVPVASVPEYCGCWLARVQEVVPSSQAARLGRALLNGPNDRGNRDEAGDPGGAIGAKLLAGAGSPAPLALPR